MIRVLSVDDHPLLREGIAALEATRPGTALQSTTAPPGRFGQLGSYGLPQPGLSMIAYPLGIGNGRGKRRALLLAPIGGEPPAAAAVPSNGTEH